MDVFLFVYKNRFLVGLMSGFNSARRSPLKQFFEAPIIRTKWRITQTDQALVRWGLILKDLLALKDWISYLQFWIPIAHLCVATY